MGRLPSSMQSVRTSLKSSGNTPPKVEYPLNIDRVNHVDRLADQTILYYAAKKGFIDMCRLLIEKGADINHVDRNNKSPADLARKNKYPEVAEYLVTEIKRFKEASKEGNGNNETNVNKEANKMSIFSQSVEESNL